MPYFECNGVRLACLDPAEAAFLARDVGAYFDRGARLSPGDTVFDVGANIGLFTAEVSRRTNGAVSVMAFEPIPPIYAVLHENASGPIKGDVRTFPFGISSQEANVQFSYYPLMSFMSSAYRDETNAESETTRAASALRQMIKNGRFMPWMDKLPTVFLEPFLEGYVKSRMKAQRHTVRVRPLSAVIDEMNIGRIDLLKIDVEGAEEDVLAGIESRHWLRIQQIVLELEKFESRAADVCQRLSGLGFRVDRMQDDVQRAGDHGLLFALR